MGRRTACPPRGSISGAETGVLTAGTATARLVTVVGANPDGSARRVDGGGGSGAPTRTAIVAEFARAGLPTTGGLSTATVGDRDGAATRGSLDGCVPGGRASGAAAEGASAIIAIGACGLSRFARGRAASATARRAKAQQAAIAAARGPNSVDCHALAAMRKLTGGAMLTALGSRPRDSGTGTGRWSRSDPGRSSAARAERSAPARRPRRMAGIDSAREAVCRARAGANVTRALATSAAV